MFFEGEATNFFDVTCWHPDHGAFTITVQRMNGKPAGQVVAELKNLLREVADWCGLDGDGISQPLLDRVRVAIGLSPYERGDDDGTE